MRTRLNKRICGGLPTAAVLLLAECAAGADTLTSTGGFTLTVPAGWSVKADKPNGPDIKGAVGGEFFLVGRLADFTFIQVGMTPAKDVPGATLTKFRDFANADQKQSFPDFKKVEERACVVDGAKGLDVRGTCTLAGRPQVSDTVYVLHAGAGYVFALMAPKNASEANRTMLNKVIASLHWIKPKK